MAPLSALSLALLGLCLGSLVQGERVEYLVRSTESPTTSTDTPGVVTNPDSDATSTLSYETTSFPIGSSTATTEHTPNVTSSGTTTTTSPSTSTQSPNDTTTTTTTMSTSTASPGSSTTPFTPTAIVPTLPPEPVAPSEPWNVTYGPKGNYCVMLSFAARVDISYTNVLGQVVQTGLDVPDNATVNANQSSCMPGSDMEMLVLDFESSPSAMGSLAVMFARNPSNNDSTIYSVEATVLVTEDLFPGIDSHYLGKPVILSVVNLTLFDTEPAHSYSCVSLIKTNLTSIKVSQTAHGKTPFQGGVLETSNLKVQAFMPSDQKIDTFLPDTACPQDKTDISSTIPITVGIILLFMVVVVLIAYFIGRSRQQKETNAI